MDDILAKPNAARPEQNNQARGVLHEAALQALANKPAARVNPPELQVTIPTLRVGEQANESDQSRYGAGSRTAMQFEEQKASVVYIAKKLDDGTFETGTGFFISTDGKIATAGHVTSQPGEYIVVTSDGRQWSARIAARKETTDVALLQLKDTSGSSFRPLPLAETSSVSAGDQVSSIGHPNGWTKTYLSPGAITARSTQRDINSGLYTLGFNPQRAVLSAEINVQPGNSGGPLLNDKGEVIGIVNFGGDGRQGDFAVVEDLKQLVSASEDKRSYLMPERLHWGSETTMLAACGATGATTQLLSRASQTHFRRAPYLGAGLMTVGGLHELVYDAPFAQKAWSGGTAAEKITSAINLTGDLGMTSSGFFALAPTLRKYAMPIALAGAGIKLVNNICSDRKY
ncbi:MAG: serine protease [Candidatus Obscuribacterales bacterium]|nr:serine protease [Candidatus Obscuribacterales bacterium]